MNASHHRRTFWNVEHCCFAWDLKSGIVVSTVIGLTVVFSSFIVNIGLAQSYLNVDDPRYYRFKLEDIMANIIMFLYLITSMVAYILLFYAVLKVKQKLLYVGWGLLSVCFLIWIVVTILSYQRNAFRSVCASTRCPDVHWFMPSGWRALIALQLLDCQSTGPRVRLKELQVSRPPNLWIPARQTRVEFLRLKRKDDLIEKVLNDSGLLGLNGVVVAEAGINIRTVIPPSRPPRTKKPKTTLSMGLFRVPPKKPSLLGIPGMPSMPSLPGLPEMPSLPSLPSLPSVPSMPSVPELPSLPEIPGIGKRSTNTSQEYTNRAIQFLQYANLMNQLEFRDLQYYYEETDDEEDEESDLRKNEVIELKRIPVRDVLHYIPTSSYTYYMDPVLVAYSVTLAVAWAIFMLHTHFLLLMYVVHIRRLIRRRVREFDGDDYDEIYERW